MLLELNEKEQLQKVSELTKIGKDTVTISAHRSLNTSRSVISEEDFLGLSDEELLEGFQEQNVVKVQRIVIRRNDQEVPTKHVILTFGTSVMPTSLDLMQGTSKSTFNHTSQTQGAVSNVKDLAMPLIHVEERQPAPNVVLPIIHLRTVTHHPIA